MKVLLLEKIRNLGNIGDQVTVKGGYGRNYLIPKQKAVFATPDKIALVQQKKAELEELAAAALLAAQQKAAGLQGTKIVLAHAAGEQGKLYGSVTTREIGEALTQQGHDIDKKDINLVEGLIRELGTYRVDLHLHADVVCSIEVEVIEG